MEWYYFLQHSVKPSMFLMKKIKLGEDMPFCMVTEDHQPQQEFIKFNLIYISLSIRKIWELNSRFRMFCSGDKLMQCVFG